MKYTQTEIKNEFELLKSKGFTETQSKELIFRLLEGGNELTMKQIIYLKRCKR